MARRPTARGPRRPASTITSSSRSRSTRCRTRWRASTQLDWRPALLGGVLRQRLEELAVVACVAPFVADALVVEAAGARRDPHFLQRRLAVDDDFRTVVDES